MSAKFLGFWTPSFPLSTFHATYQYCLSATFGDFSTPLPSPLHTDADVLYEFSVTVYHHWLAHLYNIVARTQTRKTPTRIDRASNHGGSRERKCVWKFDTSILVLRKYDTKSDLLDG